MTMTPELRAAAERLRRNKDGERVTAIYLCPRGNSSRGQRTAYATVQQTKDRAILADWALQHLPPDDDSSQIDDAFLRSIGFDADEDEEMHLFFTDAKGQGKWLEVEFESRIWFYLKMYDGSNSMRVYLAFCETRGAVRRLLAVLGVK